MNHLSRRDFIRNTSLTTAGLLWASGPVSSFGHEPTSQIADSDNAQLRFRQIHLDFHTSEHITGIGDKFDPEEFASTLKKAAVNSVTCFGRCHHGYLYFDTKAFPERHHPHLKRNLLKEQIEACHKQNIRVPVYTTIQWDHFSAQHHPEWLVIDETGKPTGTPIYEPGFYRNLCVNTPYRDFLKAHIKETFEAVPVDGLFLDIVKVIDCSCAYCREGMTKKGLEPSNKDDRMKYATQVMSDFKNEMTALIRSLDKKCTIFYNGGHVGPGIRETLGTYSHLELESLPSGGWGYLHFPLTSRFARTLNKDFLGMTGKFHTSWGDFHSLKNQAALQFECFTMLAMNGKCSVGDQLHPNGKIDQATYDLIGSVYREIEKKEPWCQGAHPVTDIGVFSVEEYQAGVRLPEPSMGVIRMLQEGNHQFDIIDSKADLSRYKVLILPDTIPVNKELNAKIEAFLQKGGAVLASYKSGLNEEGKAFALQSLGIDYVGDAPYSPDFIVPSGVIGEGLPATEHVMYLKGLQVKPKSGTKVLADAIEPYFNRTYQHFSSHKHTPSAGKAGYPAVTQKDKVIYFIHPLFTQYNQNAPRWCKQLFLNALNVLLPDALIKAKGPTTLITSLNEQPAQNRRVLHLLHYVPEHRGRDFDVMEDIIPLYNVPVSVLMPKKVQRVEIVPQKSQIKFEQKGNRVEFILPELHGHQMVALQM